MPTLDFTPTFLSPNPVANGFSPRMISNDEQRGKLLSHRWNPTVLLALF
jgi:hypothetical protein